ncbi:FLU1 Major facilitator superfamily multidrug transporter FLU1 [Candida maltosa Xu316]
MGLNKPYPPLLGQRDPYLVSFDGPSDPAHPFNFPLWKKKIPYCATVGLCALSVSIGSAMFSQSIEEITEIYHVGWSVAALSTSLYVLGFAAGPIFYGPLSELFGRKFVLIPSSFGYICFSFLVGSAKDLQTILICRFFAGFIGAAPMVVSAAIMADLFDYRSRGTAIVVYAMMIFGGPMIAPIMGGFTVKNSALGWRWTSYFCGIIGAIALFMNVFVLEETRHPIILVRRAEELRRRTGNWGIAAPHEELRLNVKEIFSRSISKPLRMLITEPILLLITIYHAFVYGLLYLLLTAIPFIYSGEYHFSPGVSELPYASMLIGVFIGGGIIIILEKKYVAAVMSNNGKLLPEKRLQPMMVGCFTFVIGIFWLGWTGSYPQHIHWIVPTIGAAFVGNGLIMIFLPCFNYIIDCYLVNAASALAANTFLRASFAAAFPLFSKQMFENLTIKWATTLLGCIGVLLIPVPFVFHFYGKAIRKKSKYAFDLE